MHTFISIEEFNKLENLNILGQTSKELVDKITAVSKVVSKNSIRNFGTLVHFDAMNIVGTDGFALFYAQNPLSLPNNYAFSIDITDISAMKAFLKRNKTKHITIYDFDNGHDGVCLNSLFLADHVANEVMVIRLSAVKFPPYMKVIDQAKADTGKHSLPHLVVTRVEVETNSKGKKTLETAHIAHKKFNNRYVKMLSSLSQDINILSDNFLFSMGAVNSLLVAFGEK
jgi:hypothetical protein